MSLYQKDTITEKMITTDFVDRDRFDRMRRIEWVDVDSIQKKRCLVVGAGALGNEVVKDLVLAGFRRMTLVDMDFIVTSNLSRCLFFRDEDVRKVMKADIVAERASELDPDVRIEPVVADIKDMDDWNYDIVLGCLDNISARMHLNAHAYYHRIPYIDGAMDGMNGRVMTILPGGPCLQCIMNRTHVEQMERRFTCTGNGTAFVPKTASDITTTAVIAAMQVREAMKVASRRSDLCVRGVTYYDGTEGTMETLDVSVDPQCMNHTE